MIEKAATCAFGGVSMEQSLSFVVVRLKQHLSDPLLSRCPALERVRIFYVIEDLAIWCFGRMFSCCSDTDNLKRFWRYLRKSPLDW